ncbi:Uu.00g107230.m01.CDS01 [Anthostomella pinea]|uniref:Uu.00g107230.m01.CDS01 n=1 Tax=Anthostomella pinea TaxID=933095 RepID=A0AAI8YFZ4_9PEZI|nr:Uu.00g107230.m01.CDS01 [Anthostomella pinea]
MLTLRDNQEHDDPRAKLFNVYIDNDFGRLDPLVDASCAMSCACEIIDFPDMDKDNFGYIAVTRASLPLTFPDPVNTFHHPVSTSIRRSAHQRLP